MTIPEPTGDQCNQNEVVWENEHEIGYAIWYPQMGGYCGKAIAIINKRQAGDEGACITCWIWHDGEFPFSGDDLPPVYMHHCDPEQFVRFGRKLAEFNALEGE